MEQSPIFKYDTEYYYPYIKSASDGDIAAIKHLMRWKNISSFGCPMNLSKMKQLSLDFF